jgi:cis-3-alkyl-4-acyloxetan-2-one decarboxylase
MTLHLQPMIEGNEAGPTLVFVQGWPDDASLWDDAVAKLRANYRCVRVTLPNFDGHESVRWGYSTDEIVDAIVGVLQEAGHGRPVTLIMHDWGSYWGHAAHHRAPALVNRIVGIDVAPHFKPTGAGAMGIVAYQSWLFGAFVVGGRVGTWMTRAFAKIAEAPGPRKRLIPSMNYPYRNIWIDLVTGRAQKLSRGYWPTCPILFVYGEQKPFHFHSDSWLAHVKTSGGKVVGLPCGHWVPKVPAFTELLAEWLAETDGAGTSVTHRA